MTSYIESKGFTVEDFYEELKKGQQDEYSKESIFAMILVASTSFDIFMTMLRESAVKMNELGRK